MNDPSSPASEPATPPRLSAGRVPKLFCFGLGFSASALARRLLNRGWSVAGTTRDEGVRASLGEHNLETHIFNRDQPLEDFADTLAGTTHLLLSIPPDSAGDPVFDLHQSQMAALADLCWVGYLSTTGVYGDTKGELVDEGAPLRPTSARSERRVLAEGNWRSLYQDGGLPVHVFRLAGIYGPGRSVLDKIRAHEARCILKPGHVFSRIHVEDVAQVLEASALRPDPGAIYNVSDDEAVEPATMTRHGCALLGTPPPPDIAFEDALKTMTPLQRSFWADRRRVSNEKIKRDLGVKLLYPDYRLGLAAVLAADLK